MGELKEYLPVIKEVLTNPYVIATAIAVFIYIDFCVFVANYRKRPKKLKKKRISRVSPPPAAKTENTENQTQEGENQSEN